MSLSGNLGFVSLDEVLRLLTRSKQSGAVDVKGDRVHGRIYVDRRGIGLATTFTDDTLRRHLTRSGLLPADQVAQVAAGAVELGSLSEAESVTGLLREMSVESLYQLGLHGTTFEVFEGQVSPFSSPGGFDLEQLLTDSKQRLTDWEEVRTIVSDMERDLMLKRDLGDRDKVTLDRDSWRVIAELGTGASIRTLADQLGTTEFWTARVAAGLVEDGLMSMETPAPTESVPEAHYEPAPQYDPWDDTDQADETPDGSSMYQGPEDNQGRLHDDDSLSEARETTTEDHEPGADSDSEPVFAETGDPEELVMPAASVDPNESWWKEPEGESEDTAEGNEQIATKVATGSTEVEEDTESFLEKVFSELEPAAEAEEGYGLLRRRRMGTLRDTGSN